MEEGVQTPDETLARRIGSCRDSAWLLVDRAAALRPGGPVRLRLPGPAGRRSEEPRRAERTRGGLHRPARVGRGLRPRRRLDRPRPDLGAVRRRGPHPAGRHPEPVVVGARSPGPPSRSETTMEFANTVRRVHEDPRVTKPYSEAQVEHLQRVGQHGRRPAGRGRHRADHGRRADLRLGRRHDLGRSGRSPPTARRSASWPTGWPRALADRFAHGGLVQRGQGKWYPGEALPRWQIG